MINPNCHRCQQTTGMQTYDVSDSQRGIRLLINVTAAYAFARAKLTPVEIPLEYAHRMILVNLSETFCGRHVDHVDRKQPPLVAIYYPTATEMTFLLLDGTHRMVSMLKHGETPTAYLLEPEHTLRFLMQRDAI